MTARRDAAGRGTDAMQVQTLSGRVGTPTHISSKRRITDVGTPYYLANVTIDGNPYLTAIHASKAWRVRIYLEGITE